MKDLKFSIIIPTYNGAKVIRDTLNSIRSQSYKNYEIIIKDDASKDNIEEVVNSYKDTAIRFYRNTKNMGYPKNLEDCRKLAKGDILYLMGQDDILEKDALLNTCKAFELSPEIGAVTRPYYWFDEDVEKPVRVKKQCNPQKDEVINIGDDYEKVAAVFNTLDQLSGLALRKKYIDIPFEEHTFTSHIYPFASIFKKHPVVFLKGYQVAVRISTSHSRAGSWVYAYSPMQSWIDLFNNVYFENKFKKLRSCMTENFVATNYLGLVQIKNYGTYFHLLREIYYLLKFRPNNLYSPLFWFFSLGTLLMPSSILKLLVDWYKNRFNSKLIPRINFKYSI